MDKNLLKERLQYPRPSMVRNSFLDMNGKWDFVFDDQGRVDPKDFPKDSMEINVPYCYQSKFSGIDDQTKHERVWYHRSFDFSEDSKEGKRIILNLEACDYETNVFVNGNKVGCHKGGYERFSFDITDFLCDGLAEIAIESIDTYDTHQPRGKQKWKDEAWGCWYQEVNGIWRSVWAEAVDPAHILSHKSIPSLKEGKVNAEVKLSAQCEGSILIAELLDGDEVISCSSIEVTGDTANVCLEAKYVKEWDVGSPYLYTIRYSVLKDETVVDSVISPFGFRDVEAKDRKIFINGKPTFLRLALEQGYYKDGIYTFRDLDEMIDEVEWIQKLGFNGIRMHQKVEDERFIYLCDVYGVYVWCEMPSPYDFDSNTVENTCREWAEVIRQYVNHPSIIVYTPINESWGVPEIKTDKEQQAFIIRLYEETKAFDPSRLVVSNDGWEHCKTDLLTLHDYVQDPKRFSYYTENVLSIARGNLKIDDMNDRLPYAEGYAYHDEPILYDEFCGIGYNVESTEKGWGYGTSTDSAKAFYERYRGLVKDAFDAKDLAGWCMTQLTNVYIEVNGLLTMDRKPKYDVEELRKVNEGKF